MRSLSFNLLFFLDIAFNLLLVRLRRLAQLGAEAVGSVVEGEKCRVPALVSRGTEQSGLFLPGDQQFFPQALLRSAPP